VQINLTIYTSIYTSTVNPVNTIYTQRFQIKFFFTSGTKVCGEPYHKKVFFKKKTYHKKGIDETGQEGDIIIYQWEYNN